MKDGLATDFTDKKIPLGLFAKANSSPGIRPGCLAVPTDVVTVRNRPSTDVSTMI
jgi:hypothetical protein